MDHGDERPAVAHVVRAFLVPGETFISNQIETLRRYHPVVFCHHRVENPDCTIVDVHSVGDLATASFRMRDGISYGLCRHLLKSSAQVLADGMRRESVRLLHFHYLVDARFFLSLKRLTGMPSVVSVYGYDASLFPRTWGGLGRYYLRRVFREMDMVIAMSQDMRRDLIALGCPEEKIKVHYYGTDTDRFGFPERTYEEKVEVSILMCGILEPKKAQDRVMAALRLWEKRTRSRNTFRLVFMGEGPLREVLENLTILYGWGDRVRFMGHVPYTSPALIEEYRKADIFTLPSVTLRGDKEGIPGTIVEAMACGMPVVSTFHAGIPEVITNDADGLLVPENDLDGLSSALGRLIEDSPLRERLGRAAAKTAANRCRLLSRTPHLESMYDELLSGASCRRKKEE